MSDEVIKIGADPRMTQIDHLYAFIVTAKDGNEGLFAMGDRAENLKPMVFSDPEIVERIKLDKELLRVIASHGARLEIVEFKRTGVKGP